MQVQFFNKITNSISLIIYITTIRQASYMHINFILILLINIVFYIIVNCFEWPAEHRCLSKNLFSRNDKSFIMSECAKSLLVNNGVRLYAYYIYLWWLVRDELIRLHIPIYEHNYYFYKIVISTQYCFT